MFLIKSDRDLTAMYGQPPHAEKRNTMNWIGSINDSYASGEALFWAFEMKENGKLAGSATLWNLDLASYSGELGYEMNRSYWRRGLASEGITAILDYAFKTMGLNRVEACPMDMNDPSKRLLVKLGFRYEGILRQRIYFDGVFWDQAFYSMLKDEWSQIRKS